MNPIILITLILILAYLLFQSFSLLFGAFYESTRKKELKTILKFANPKPTVKIADLGSGIGKILIPLAKSKAEIHGFEINPVLVIISKIKTRKIKNIHIHWKSFWKPNFKKFNTIITYQINYLMPRLKRKILKQCKPKTKIISNTWKFPDWKPEKHQGKIRLYKI